MKYTVLLLAVFFVFGMTFAVTTQAESDWDLTGGMAITNVTLDTWNESIDELNVVMTSPLFGDAEEMDNIEKVPMIYIGATREVNEKLSTEFRYEYIFGAVEGSVKSPAGKGEIDVKLHGLTGLVDYQLNDNWTVGGGLGFHWGTKTKDFDGALILNAATPDHEEFDLDGMSYRLGLGYERAIAENWDFNGSLDYIYLELDDEEEGNVYSKGLSYNLGLAYNF